MVQEIDLDTLDKQELIALSKRIDKHLADLEKRREKEAREKVKDVLAEFGMSMSDLTREDGDTKKAPKPPKFRNPDDHSVTWSGRGRRPEWYKEALENGYSEDDLLIR